MNEHPAGSELNITTTIIYNNKEQKNSNMKNYSWWWDIHTNDIFFDNTYFSIFYDSWDLDNWLGGDIPTSFLELIIKNYFSSVVFEFMLQKFVHINQKNFNSIDIYSHKNNFEWFSSNPSNEEVSIFPVLLIPRKTVNLLNAVQQGYQRFFIKSTKPFKNALRIYAIWK